MPCKQGEKAIALGNAAFTDSIVRRWLLPVIVLCYLVFATVNLSLANEESWLRELDELCGSSQAAMTLSSEEVTTLVERCDRIIAEITGTDNPRKKLYLFRLERCRNFYQYIINLKSKERSGK